MLPQQRSGLWRLLILKVSTLRHRCSHTNTHLSVWVIFGVQTADEGDSCHVCAGTTYLPVRSRFQLHAALEASLWWSWIELHSHSFYSGYPTGGQNNGNIVSTESKASVQRVKMLPLCVLPGGLDPSSLLWSRAKHTNTFTATLLPASCADEMRSQAPII